MTLSAGRLFSYSAGALATGVFSTVPTVLLIYFCTDTLGMPAGLAGLVVLVPKLWAVSWDPLVGMLSDRARTRFGRRKPFMVIGALGVGASFVLLFAWPYPAGAGAFGKVAMWYLALVTAYALFAVPYIAIPSEISPKPAERERVTSWRIAMAMFGVFLGAALAPEIVHWGGGGRQGYAVMAIVIALICTLGMTSAILATPNTRIAHDGTPARLSDTVQVLRRTPVFLLLIASYVLQICGIGMMSSLAPYWVVYRAGLPAADTGLALGCMLLIAMLAAPAWSAVIARSDARRVVLASAALYGIICLAFPMLPKQNAIALFVAYALLGVPFAGLQVGPFVLATHCIHGMSIGSSATRQGLFTGIWTAAEKLALALGPALAAFGLSLIGFRSGAVTQAASTLAALGIVGSIVPAILVWSSIWLLVRRTDGNTAPKQSTPS